MGNRWRAATVFVLLAASPALADVTRGTVGQDRLSRPDRLVAKTVSEDAAEAGQPDRQRITLSLPAGVKSASLGLIFADDVDAFLAAIGMTGETGAMIARVDRDGAAAKAGARPGDLIVAVNGARVGGPGQLRVMLRDKESTPFELSLVRVGRGPVDLVARLRAIAAVGNRDATLALGDASFLDLDNRRTPELARTYYERAYAMGDARAAQRLGLIYETGTGVRPDLAMATHWYEVSAQAGVAAGEHALAVMWWTGRYWTGLALESSFPEAVRLFELAAAQGYVASYSYLGLAYEQGLGVERDPAEAEAWYQEAIAAGDVDAMVRLASMVEAGTGRDPDPAHALELLKLAALEGSAEANFRLGEKYWQGDGVMQHPINAIDYLEVAAERGDPRAMSLIAEILLSGYGVRRDAAGAVEWYFRAWRAGDAGAAYALALAHADGVGVVQDSAKVAGFIFDAIRRGSSAALAEMKGNAEAWDISIREDLQELLQAAGFYQGAIDGVFGPGTLRALDAAAGG